MFFVLFLHDERKGNCARREFLLNRWMLSYEAFHLTANVNIHNPGGDRRSF
jgi:hypothetical protein